MVAVGVVTAVAAPLVIPAALGVIGFGGAGVAAGSVAAGWQAAIGNVAAGSFFASLQSVGAAGISGATSLATGAVTGGATTAVGGISKTSGDGILTSSLFNDVLVPYMFAVVADWVYDRLF